MLGWDAPPRKILTPTHRPHDGGPAAPTPRASPSVRGPRRRGGPEASRRGGGPRRVPRGAGRRVDARELDRGPARRAGVPLQRHRGQHAHAPRDPTRAGRGRAAGRQGAARNLRGQEPRSGAAHAEVLADIAPTSARRDRSGRVLVQGTRCLPTGSQKFDELIPRMRALADAPDVPPALQAAELHDNVAAIQPLGDGNGRTARLLMNSHLLRHGHPHAIIEVGERAEDLSALEEANDGRCERFAAFVLRSVEHHGVRWWIEIRLRTSEIRLPDRASPLRAHRPPAALFGVVLDRGVAGPVRVPDGSKRPGSRSRGHLRAIGMESGVDGGKPCAPSQASAAAGRDGAHGRGPGRLRRAAKRRARHPSSLDWHPTDERPSLGRGHLRPRSENQGGLTCGVQRGRKPWATIRRP